MFFTLTVFEAATAAATIEIVSRYLTIFANFFSEEVAPNCMTGRVRHLRFLSSH